MITGILSLPSSSKSVDHFGNAIIDTSRTRLVTHQSSVIRREALLRTQRACAAQTGWP